MSTLEKYTIFTFIELVSRGYESDKAGEMVKRSELHKLLLSSDAWAYCHDMGPKEWADWIEVEFGYKPRPIPVWEQIP